LDEAQVGIWLYQIIYNKLKNLAMKTKIILLFFGLLSFLPNAQIGISKDTSFQPDSRAMLHIKQDNFAARIPRSNTALSLPVSETATTGTGTQGSIIFNRETEVLYRMTAQHGRYRILL
jgi:hypothetical protein